MQLADLTQKKGLVLGIANEDSIAYGCAKVFAALGAELAITYQNEKAKPHVEALAKALNASHCLECDVTDEKQMEQLFDVLEADWGGLDFVLHSIAFAPKDTLHGTVTANPAMHDGGGYQISGDIHGSP